MAGNLNPTDNPGTARQQKTTNHFFNDKRESEDHILHFYERNPAGRGLDFDDYPENQPAA